MTPFSKFQEDLARELIFEDLIIELFKKHYNAPETDIIRNDAAANNSSFDFKIKGVGYEIKNNHYSVKSGNVCVEYMNRGKPSCISLTTSEYQIHSFYGKYIAVIDTDVLKAFLKQHYRTSRIRDVRSGDTGRDGFKVSKSLIVSVVDILSICKTVFNFETGKMVDVGAMTIECLAVKTSEARLAINL